MIDLKVTSLAAATVNVTPGQLNAVTVFTRDQHQQHRARRSPSRATNPGTGDDFDMNQPPATGTPGYILRVDANGNGTYERGYRYRDRRIPTLARNACGRGLRVG